MLRNFVLLRVLIDDTAMQEHEHLSGLKKENAWEQQ